MRQPSRSNPALLLAAAALLLAPAAAKGSSGFHCTPGHKSCWPTDAEWHAFNQSISGRLEATVPMGSVCYSDSPTFDDAACDAVKASYGVGSFRQSFAGAMELTQFEACGADNCYPGLFGPLAPKCTLGRLPPLFVNVETARDISRTLTMARRHSIRVVVKNTGHDYSGRSTAANALGLRTRNMKDMSFEARFRPHKCPAAGTLENIGIIGAGVTAEEAVAFFGKHGMLVTVGGCPSVGIAGGFGQIAGHGPLSPTYGLMVDQAVEFDVVTPDGVFRTINQCNDPDLFWAIRGGGAQSFAILVNYKFRLHPAKGAWASWLFQATISPTDPDVTQNKVLRDVLTRSASEQPHLSKNAVSGYSIWLPESVLFLEILPVGKDPLKTLKGLTAGIHGFVTGHPGLNVTVDQYSLHETEADFFTDRAAILGLGGTVGANVILPSRLITKENFAHKQKVDALVDGILKGFEAARVTMGGDLGQSILFATYKTGASNTPDPHGYTSTNPAWRDTLWQFATAGVSLPGSPANVSTLVNAAARAGIKEVAKPLAVQASYPNESDPGEEDWQHLFYGAHYDKLLTIKKKYDPDTLLNCWKCVGWLGEHDPMYSCYGDHPVPSVAFASL